MRDGYVKAYRKMLDNPVVMKDAEHFAVWMWLLLNATHGKYDTIFKGEKVTLSNGQMVTGRVKIAQELKISESKVERILKSFESEHQIEQQKSNKNRLITVVKWREYQKREQQNEQQLNNNWTTTEQQLNTYNNIYNNTCSDNSNVSNNLPENEKNVKEHDNPPNPPKGGKGRKKDEKKICNRDLMDTFFQANPNITFDESIMDALHDWCDYKEQKKQRYAKVGMKNLLDDVLDATKQYDTYSVAKSIRKCMASNYDGIFYRTYAQDKRNDRVQQANDLIEQLRREEEANEKK